MALRPRLSTGLPLSILYNLEYISRVIELLGINIMIRHGNLSLRSKTWEVWIEEGDALAGNSVFLYSGPISLQGAEGSGRRGNLLFPSGKSRT